MKKARVVALTLAATSLVTLLVVAWIAETKYGAVFRAPRVPHETYATGNTSLKVVVKPPLAQRRIAAMLLPGRSVPDWMLSMTVPEETAMLFDSDLNAEQLGVRLFINYARLGPVIRDAVNQAGITKVTPGITWNAPEIAERERGVLLLEGSAPIPVEFAKGARDQWAAAGAYPPPDIEGTHAFELVMENRNGKGYAALVTLIEMNAEVPPQMASFLSPKTFYVFSTLRAYADFETEDVLNLTIVAEANPTAGEKPEEKVKTFLDLGVGLAKGELRKNYGVVVEGKSVVDGLTVRGQYRVTGIDALIAPGPAGSGQ